MKKLFLSTFLLALPLLASAYKVAAENEDGVTIYYNYINDGTELEVTYGSGNFQYSGVINIPDEVSYGGQTLPVTSIGDGTFYNNDDLTSVTIPNSVTTIGYSAFYSCDGLTSVNIPNSVTTIGENAFAFCVSLPSVNIPNSVISIGKSAFKNCSSLTTLTIPNSVSIIEESTFQHCDGLTSLTISNGVTKIGRYAFGSCYNLTSIIIPNSVYSIGYSAFSVCEGLTSVTLPSSLAQIGDEVFYRCNNLTYVTSKMVHPCPIAENCFRYGIFHLGTLYVPEGCIENYKSVSCWNQFDKIEEFVSVVTEANAPAESVPVQVSVRDGKLTVKSEQEGQSVAVYSIDGKYLGSAKVSGGQAIIGINQPKGELVVVKVGERSVKASL